MPYPKRPITDEEIARANAQPVDEIDLNRTGIAAALAAFDYLELQPAKELIKESTAPLTVGDIYNVWSAVSRALDVNTTENQSILDELESDCAEVVTTAWDKEMELSDRAERQQNVMGCYRAPVPQPAPDSIALMLKKVSGSIEWVAIAIFLLTIVQCSSDKPQRQTQANAVHAPTNSVIVPATDFVTLIEKMLDEIKASQASDSAKEETKK